MKKTESVEKERKGDRERDREKESRRTVHYSCCQRNVLQENGLRMKPVIVCLTQYTLLFGQ